MSATPGAPWQSANLESLVGRVFAERFRLDELLGCGGMGAVYAATQLQLKRRVAVKVLSPQLAKDANHVERFRREAQSASNLVHRNIVDVIDFGEAGDLVFYAMEFLEGEDLASLLARESKLSWADTKPILLQVLRGLRAAHGKGVIHRDIKPANIFLVPDDDRVPCVKLLDFGIAKVIRSDEGQTLTRSDELFGSVKYMAPEQADGRPVDARTDVYAVGVVLYRMLTGRVPFDDDNAFRVLTRHQVEAPAPPRSIVATITEHVEAIVLRALAKAPGDRFDTMTSFEAAVLELDAAGERGAPAAARPITEPPPVEGRHGTEILARTELAPATEPTVLLTSRHESPRLTDAPEPPPLVVAAPIVREVPAAPNPATSAAPRRPASLDEPRVQSGGIGVVAASAANNESTLFEVRSGRPTWMLAALGVVVALAVGGVAWVSGVIGEDPQAGPTVVAVPEKRAPPETAEPPDAAVIGPKLEPTVRADPPVAEPVPAPVPLSEPTPVDEAPEPAPTQPSKKPANKSASKPPSTKPEPAPAKPSTAPSDASLIATIKKKALGACSGAPGDTVTVKVQVREAGGALYARPEGTHKHTALGKCVAKEAKMSEFVGTGSNRMVTVEVKF